MLGIRACGRRMVGPDGSTELWRLSKQYCSTKKKVFIPKNLGFTPIKKKFSRKLMLRLFLAIGLQMSSTVIFNENLVSLRSELSVG